MSSNVSEDRTGLAGSPMDGRGLAGFQPVHSQAANESESETQRIERYEATLRAIANCTLVGPDFGDWVQSVCEDALDGLWPECWNCGTFVHSGPCAGEGDE